MRLNSTPLDFVVDRIVKGKAYPALATHQAEPYTPGWREFVYHHPSSIPVELFEHAQTHSVDINITTDIKLGYYPIGLGFFNFDIDYFSLLSPPIVHSVSHGILKILFYYHEGDNPYHIKSRLDQLCAKNNLPLDCYHFVSGNTAAKEIENFHYFPDHELLFWHRNREISAEPIHQDPRRFNFTILNRTHKWWRASVMTDLQRNGLLDRSQWSYNFDIECGDRPEDNPIEIDMLGNLRLQIENFKKICPHTCDDLDSNQHNDHHLHVPGHFRDSYCSIILETHFDADGSQGSFLTEKTFKCLKHGHPFILVGPPGSLETLRDLGYKTFDDHIDQSYDKIKNNTNRWRQIMRSIKELDRQDLHQWFNKVADDCLHNQKTFLSSKDMRINQLLDSLNTNFHKTT